MTLLPLTRDIPNATDVGIDYRQQLLNINSHSASVVSVFLTYMRNTGGVGIALACAYGATTDYLGTFPPTPEQIEVMAQTIAAVADGLWLTIDKEHVMTHGEAADNEDGLALHELYGPQHGCERWDLEYLGIPESPGYDPWAVDGSRGGDVLRGKANWYRQQKMNKGVY